MTGLRQVDMVEHCLYSLIDLSTREDRVYKPRWQEDNQAWDAAVYCVSGIMAPQMCSSSKSKKIQIAYLGLVCGMA